jgi:protein SCO1/2
MFRLIGLAFMVGLLNASVIAGETGSDVDLVLTVEGNLPIEQRGGDFTLFGAQGPVSLSDFRGKVVAIYFGYSQCPDVCPTNLSILTAAMKQLSPKELAGFQAIFVSVDPGRDDPERLAKYATFFHPEMLGISGAPVDLMPVVAQYGAFFEVVSYSNSEMLYGIDHTSETYLVGKDGVLAAILPHATPRDQLLEAIRRELESIR